MKIFAAQYDSHSGPRADRSFRLVLTVDETQSKALFNLVAGTPKGTEFLFLAFHTTEEEQDIKNLVEEDSKQTKLRLYKQMHALITKVALESNKDGGEIKKMLKEYLFTRNYIKKSTKELDLRGLSAAIYYLRNET